MTMQKTTWPRESTGQMLTTVLINIHFCISCTYSNSQQFKKAELYVFG